MYGVLAKIIAQARISSLYPLIATLPGWMQTGSGCGSQIAAIRSRSPASNAL
jgi:hypothetical protein